MNKKIKHLIIDEFSKVNNSNSTKINLQDLTLLDKLLKKHGINISSNENSVNELEIIAKFIDSNEYTFSRVSLLKYILLYEFTWLDFGKFVIYHTIFWNFNKSNERYASFQHVNVNKKDLVYYLKDNENKLVQNEDERKYFKINRDEIDKFYHMSIMSAEFRW